MVTSTLERSRTLYTPFLRRLDYQVTKDTCTLLRLSKALDIASTSLHSLPPEIMAGVAPVAARFKLVFTAPPTALATYKTAIFKAGAGCYPGSGNYTECCFTSMGTYQFRSGDTANPHVGSAGVLEEVELARVETLCVGEEVVKAAAQALKSIRLDEKVDYEVYKVEDF